MQKKSIMKGAMILTLASLFTRIIGFVYRIWMSNLIGAEGMGLYQLIVPIYSLAWSISSSGFATTVSKLTAAENAKRMHGNMGLILKLSVLVSTFIGLILSAILYFFSEYIAVSLFNDARIISSLKILAVMFPFMAAGSCLRGYFYGLQEQVVPAVSQVIEQIIRIFVIYIFASLFLPKGLEYACSLAVIGICAGEVISFLYVLYSYKIFKEKNILIQKPLLTPWSAYGIIFAMALPLTANRVTGSFLGTIENILIPQKLQAFGLSPTEAISDFGRLTGMVMPLLMFPSSLLVAIATALIPAVSEAKAVKNNARIKYTVSKSMLFTSIIGIGASSLFVTFSNELGIAVYNQNNIGGMLFLMGLVSPFLYYQVTLSGVLNGLGEQMFIFRNSLISSVICISFIYFLVPMYGINGFIAGWITSLVVVSFLDIQRVIKRTGITINFDRWIFKPVLSSVACSLSIKLAAKNIIYTFFGDTTGLIVSICLLTALYIFFILAMNVISFKDIKTVFESVLPLKSQNRKLY